MAVHDIASVQSSALCDHHKVGSHQSNGHHLEMIFSIKNRDIIYIPNGSFGIKWHMVAVIVSGIMAHAYALWILTNPDNWTYSMFATQSFAIGYQHFCGLGVAAGAHRLWSHRSYRAKLGLRIFLMLGQSGSGIYSIYTWCFVHHLHHQFSDSDADPHNASRGLFYSHIGWLMKKEHPKLRIQQNKLDLSFMFQDPVVQFQYKYYPVLSATFCILLPTLIPVVLFGESLITSLMIAGLHRYMNGLHYVLFVNSLAHAFGSAPFNRQIRPKDNPFVSFSGLGEGYHNFHHTFPYDYRSSEDGVLFNFARHFLDLMAFFGLAHDLRTASDHNIRNQKQMNSKY